ncbi:MAG: hypothetical protein QNK05_11750 [Myxococcota bacterium]|nr:hypothetical protein [Myxococcota bacterium]
MIRAGVARVGLPAEPGTAMMGYGARLGMARATHDPLHVRALYLAGTHPEPCDHLWIEADLCLIAPLQADEVRARMAERTGVAPERITVGCIHTHSAPDTGLGQLIGGVPLPDHVPGLFDAMVEAASRAVEGAEPARIGVGHAAARIGRNRRLEDGPLDEDVLVLRVDRSSGEPMAVAYVHGCHPTALGHDNLEYSADWPAAAAATIEAALPGCMAFFALGAHADIDPRTRGLLDLAIPNQSVGVSFDETEALGREIGEAAVAAARSVETVDDAPIAVLRERMAIPALRSTPGERAAALEALELPPDHPARTHELYGMEHERTKHLPEETRRERIARVRWYLRNHTADRFTFGPEPEVEVQVIRIGSARLLALPLEPTTHVGLDWKERVAGPDAAVLGIANGWYRYLPHEKDLADPLAHQKYEVLQAALVPEAAAQLLACAARLDARIDARIAEEAPS